MGLTEDEDRGSRASFNRFVEELDRISEEKNRHFGERNTLHMRYC